MSNCAKCKNKKFVEINVDICGYTDVVKKILDLGEKLWYSV